MNDQPFSPFIVAAVVVVLPLLLACSSDEHDDPSASVPPLQPLIYTEYPDLTPQGAAVRERRLERELLEGLGAGLWGRLQAIDGQPLPALDDPETLGQSVFEALIERDERQWENAFITGDEYADVTDVDRERAAEFVDNQIGASLPLWELFAPDRVPGTVREHWKDELEFVALELGSPQRLEGGQPRSDDEVVEYRDNHLVLRVVDEDLSFRFAIERLFRIPSPVKDLDTPEQEDGLDPANRVFRIGSAVEVDPRLQTYLVVGLHRKPQLLRAREYPFPLGIGSFWRYRRFDADLGADDEVDPLEQRLDDRRASVAAQEVIVEVRNISRYGTMRLVELLRSYDDRDYTRVQEWWLLTPQRIYICPQACRDHIEDTDWLLDFFAREVPIFRFPLRVDHTWTHGAGAEASQPEFVVGAQWHDVDTPAGRFNGAYRIEGRGPLGQVDPYAAGADVERFFVPERGIVRRRLQNSQESDPPVDVDEELVQYRLMH